MIIASRIGDGRVVFMSRPGAWVDSIDEGLLIEDAPEGERLLEVAQADEAECLVINPYLIDIVVEDRRRRPSSIREAIRAFGPTIRSEFRHGR